MKREAQAVDQPYSKRPKHDGSQNGRSYHDVQRDPRMNPDRYRQQNQSQNQSQSGPQDRRPHHSQPSGRNNGRGHASRPAPSTVAAPGPQDPAASLETLLRSLTARPEAVSQVLGPSALEHASQLLSCISALDRSAKASLDLFQPVTVQQPNIHSYSTAQSIQQYPLPPLPPVPEGPLSQAIFTHKSTTTHDRVSGASDLTYEKLEFLGDAYIEIIATRLIFARYPDLTAGRQAQTRERIVKNETLAQFGNAYDFRQRLQASDIEHAAPKAATKILADVFEAYVAAVVLSDPVDGFRRAEQWLTELWAPILLDSLGPGSHESAQAEYNGNAKQELQQKILSNDARLDYLEERPMEQSKHAQKYFVGLYLTGYGHEKKKIGYGEGRNKVEAGNRAAMQAMELNRAIVEDAAAQLAAMREQKRLEREEREKAESAQA